MSEENEKNLLEMIKLMSGEIRHLRQIVHLQHAEVRALRIYAAAKIADLQKRDRKADRKAEFEAVEKLMRELYDEHISKLETKFPAIASDIDIRGSMPQQERDLWYLLDDYYRKKEPPRNG
jgi:hypothetical protein